MAVVAVVINNLQQGRHFVRMIVPLRDAAPPGWFREAVLFLVCPGFAGQDSVSDEMQVH